MKISLTPFAIDRHFKPGSAGTVITDCTPELFIERVRIIRERSVVSIVQGYAPFCKLMFVPNWTDAKTGTMPITGDDYWSQALYRLYLKTEYKARQEDELPVLVRWLEMPEKEVPRAEYLCLVLYDREQLNKEGTDIGDADYGIVAVLGQMHSQEEPINPATMIRNALGIKEGGSGVPIDREAYMRSVEFWNTHATVKVNRNKI